MPSAVLMERASLAVAAELMARRGDELGEVCVLVGPGNNGGDGLAVARILAGRGICVVAHLVTARRNAAAQTQLELARAHGVAVREGVPAATREPAWVVDAMLGTGARGAPRDAVGEAVRWCEGRRVVAVDLPTGVDADEGTCPGAAVRADCTVTFERSKPGLHLTPGRDHAGDVVVARIGLVGPDDLQVRTRLVDLARAAQRWSPSGDVGEIRHKGDRGHLGLLAGGVDTPGAALLAGVAALRGGAGLVTVRLADATARAALVARRPELMTEASDAGPLLRRADALVVGPGLTDQRHGVDLAELWASDPRPAVWDASGLDHIPDDRTRAPAGRGVRVITPHPGEAARLLSRIDGNGGQAWTSQRVQGARLLAARRLAQLTDAIAVLKGAGSVVAAPDGRVWLCTAGGPELSSAGTGDVLAGLLGARLAAATRHPNEGTVEETIGLGVVAHALAGRRALERRPRPVALDVAEAVDVALSGMAQPVERGLLDDLGYPRTRWA